MNEIIQKAIEFGIKQERERAEFMSGLGAIEEHHSALWHSPKLDAIKTEIAALQALANTAPIQKAAKVPKQPKAAKAARAPRQSGVMAAVKDALAKTGDGSSLKDLVVITSAKEATVRAALRTLTANGFAIAKDGKWHSVSQPSNANGAEANSAAA